MGHGYFKVSGKPLAVACHGTVGIQHAAMAVYNAWCDRVPVVLLAGNHLDADERARGRRVGALRAGLRAADLATTSNGTTRRCRCRISPSRSCERTRSR